ncbi:MAG: choice-of-anchor D domain-containing protein [Acidobacteriia bacterium]|nr:choice-of-anchor D domain-containing protein [Terriglobia bacterium]
MNSIPASVAKWRNDHILPGQGRGLCLAAAYLFFALIFFLAPTQASAAVSVSISPSSVNLPASGTQQFTATVTGASDTSVTWTIQEGPAGGTISGAGLYAAPAVVGVYHVIATSNADNSQTVTATVGVPGFVQSGLYNRRGGHTATLLPNGTILFAGGAIVPGIIASASAEIYDPVTNTSVPTGNLATARGVHTATLLPNGKVLLVGGQSPTVQTETAELYDPVSGTFAATGSMSVARSGHTATLLPNGKVLIAGGGNCNSGCAYFNTAELYDPGSGTFSPTGSLATPYFGAEAILLPGGKVLIAGGSADGTNSNSFAELYDPSTGLFTLTGALVNPRQEFTATLLASGKVLLAGGLVNGAVSVTAEIFDPFTGAFTSTGSLSVPRALHTATLLSNGKVLIASGNSTLSRTAANELYDPVSGTFSLTGNLGEPRFDHTATALSNGSVVIAGGITGQILGSVEPYDPSAGIFNSRSVFMNVSRIGQAEARLADGSILITGGADQNKNGALTPTAEIYDPATRKFTLTGSMNSARQLHTATLLPNGKVLVVGGVNNPMAGPNAFVLVPTAELYDPVSGTFSLTGSPSVPRGEHTATLLANGKVLIAGGLALSETNPATPSAELYDPSTGAFSAAANMTVERARHTATLLNSGKVMIAGGIPPPVIMGTIPITGPAGEIYDPVAGSFTPVGPLTTGEGLTFAATCCSGQIPLFDSTLLPSGQVMVGLGYIFDPVSNTFSPIPHGRTANSYSITVLPNGEILAADGSDFIIDLNSSFYETDLPTQLTRQSPVAYLLSTGQVMLASGSDAREADFFVPPVASTAPVVTGISPNPVTGFAAVPITIQGSNFTTGSVVSDFFVPLQTTFVSSTQLNAIFPAQSLLNPGNHEIEVTNTEDPRIATSTLLVVNPRLQSTVPQGWSLNFSNVNVGSSAGLPVTLTNIGNQALTVNSLTISGTGSADFTFDPATNCPAQGLTLAPQAACSATVKFAPLGVGTFNAVLTVTYQVPGSPLVIQLTGIGVGVPVATTAPFSLTFGNQAIGTSSAPQTVTITSTGSATLQFGSTTLSDTADFRLTSTCPGSLAPNTNCSLGLTFAPSTVGNISGSAVVQANDGGSPHIIPLTGTGTGFALSPATGSSASATIAAGQPATYQLSLAPQAFSGSVTLTCAPVAAIPNATCMVSPSPVTLSGTLATTVTVSVTTAAHSGLWIPGNGRRLFNPGVYSRGSIRLLFLLSIMAGIIAASRKGWRKIPLAFSMVLLLALLATGCAGGGGGMSGGGSGGTPAGTYQLLVTASSSSVTRTMTLTLTVQ